MQSFEEVAKLLNSKDTIQKKVFNLLQDKKWHCRVCEGTSVASGQYAGGGGIQGLERGTQSRAGLVILSENRYCQMCDSVTTHDMLTGETKQSNAPSNIPKKLQNKIINHFGNRDVLEQRKRPVQELVIDHKVPMERWGATEKKHDLNMSVEEIEKKFQLLKKDEGGNHNLLKSRSCEKCIATGKRGYPLGIKYWYAGDEDWPTGVPKSGPDAERGCIGCGWYDLNAWRDSLNSKVKR